MALPRISLDAALFIIAIGLLLLVGCRQIPLRTPTGQNDVLPDVKDVIKRLADQFREMNAEREKSGEPGVIMVKEATVELSFVAKKSSSQEGGLKLEVLSAGTTKAVATEAVQKITVKLVPLKDVVREGPSPPRSPQGDKP